MEDTQTSILLSKDESAVLFDLLSRFSESRSLSIVDSSEEFILYDILADLEKSVPHAFDSDYKQILESAREKVRSMHGK